MRTDYQQRMPITNTHQKEYWDPYERISPELQSSFPLRFFYCVIFFAKHFWAKATNPANKVAVPTPIWQTIAAARAEMPWMAGRPVALVARWPMKASSATAAPPLIRIRDLMVALPSRSLTGIIPGRTQP